MSAPADSTYLTRAAIMGAGALSPVARLLALRILDMQGLDKGACLLPVTALAEFLGCSERHARRALAELKSAGMLARRGRGLVVAPPHPETDARVMHDGRPRPEPVPPASEADTDVTPPMTPASVAELGRTPVAEGAPPDGRPRPSTMTPASVDHDAGVIQNERRTRERTNGMVGSGAGWGAPRPAPPPPPSVAYDDERSREERELAAALRAINGAWERRWASQNAEQLGAPKADDGRRIARWLVANRAGYGTTLEVLAERIVAGFFDAKLALRKPQRRPRSEWLAEDPGRYATRPAEADHAAHKRATARATSDRDAEIEARYRRAELEAEAPPSMVGELLSGLRLGRTGS